MPNELRGGLSKRRGRRKGGCADGEIHEVGESVASGAGLVLFRRLEHVRCAERPGVRRQRHEP